MVGASEPLKKQRYLAVTKEQAILTFECKVAGVARTALCDVGDLNLNFLFREPFCV